MTAARVVAGWIDGRPAEPFAFPSSGEFVRDLLAGCRRFVRSAARVSFPADEFLAKLHAESVAAEPLVGPAGKLLGFVAVADDRAVRPGSPDARPVLRAVAPRVVAELLRSNPPATEPAHRLETLGRLVAGVAHDFNNLLTVISGNAELLRAGLPEADPRRGSTDLIAATARTAAGVARQLLAFSKPGAAAPCPLDPNAAVRRVERILRKLAGGRIELDVLLAPGVAPVVADPGQFDQVLLNLVVNARDAIAGAGTVTVRTAEVTVSPGRPGWPGDRPPGEYVAVTVTDTGSGMPAEVKEKAFDPFFTTKVEAGTGLGLATVRDAVRGAGGHVEIESAPGWGTTVRAYWPKAEGWTAPHSPAAPELGQGETILLVQDAEAERDVAAMALLNAGYRVLEAGDPDAAEERARLYAGGIDLLVTDLGLPKRNGPELAGRLGRSHPGVKVLFVSGYPTPPGQGAAFLAKPYSPNELLDAVRKALDGA